MLDGTLHCEDLVAFALALLLHECEDSIIEKYLKSIVEELSNWHLFMIIFVLNHLQKIIEQVVIGTTFFSLFDVFLSFMLFLDFIDEKLYLFLKTLMVRSFGFIELNLSQSFVLLNHADEILLAFLFPLEFFMLSEHQFLKAFIVLQHVSYDIKLVRGDIT